MSDLCVTQCENMLTEYLDIAHHRPKSPLPIPQILNKLLLPPET